LCPVFKNYGIDFGGTPRGHHGRHTRGHPPAPPRNAPRGPPGSWSGRLFGGMFWGQFWRLYKDDLETQNHPWGRPKATLTDNFGQAAAAPPTSSLYDPQKCPQNRPPNSLPHRAPGCPLGGPLGGPRGSPPGCPRGCPLGVSRGSPPGGVPRGALRGFPRDDPQNHLRETRPVERSSPGYPTRIPPEIPQDEPGRLMNSQRSMTHNP
jgi:hypothetical protein